MTDQRINRCACAALSLLLLALPGRGEDNYQQTLTEEDRTLEIEISPEFKPAQRETLVQWITFISGSLRTVYGYWPRQTWRISVSPADALDSDPIPWAQVHRDEIDTVEFFTAPQATTEALKKAWTGYHELAHLLIPYRGWGDTWFSEGLASFYQNILPARSGILSEQQAWQHIYEGLLRGRADTQFNGQTLATVSAAMRDEGGYMRVYWSGAWYFLAIDLRLRQQSGGRNTLDLALQKLNICCADDSLSVVQMVNKLDELNEVLMFQPLYQQLNVTTEMPEFEKMFASLGITIVDGAVILQQEGPGAQLRQELVRPRPL
jgi:hypothetical protein